MLTQPDSPLQSPDNQAGEQPLGGGGGGADLGEGHFLPPLQHLITFLPTTKDQRSLNSHKSESPEIPPMEPSFT